MGKKRAITLLAAGAGVGALVYWRKQTQQPADAPPPWTVADMPDQTGRVAIVTGANSGLGYETALALARKGARVIMACRNLEKGAAALKQIQAAVPGADLDLLALDLADLAAVRRFAEAFRARYQRLDLLINNAGIMMVPYGKTADGFERQMGTNHLGHFALTGLLLDLLTATPGARVVNVSSNGHRFGQMDFDNLLFEEGRDYSPMAAYGRSKLANLLFTLELQRRLTAMGAPVLAVSAHPGMAESNLADHLLDRPVGRLLEPLSKVMLQSSAMGALPTLRAAVDPDARGGDYFGPGGFREQRGYPVPVQAGDAAYDAEVARQLWAASEKLTGVVYGAPEPV